jgi:hypothetical protein
VHIVVGPCAKGHFIHARAFFDPEFFFFLEQRGVAFVKNATWRRKKEMG